MSIRGDLKTIKKTLHERQMANREIKILFAEGDETTEECLARNGISEDDPNFNIIISRWARHYDEIEGVSRGINPAAWKETPEQSVEDEINSLISDLENDGLSLEEISEMIKVKKRGIRK